MNSKELRNNTSCSLDGEQKSIDFLVHKDLYLLTAGFVCWLFVCLISIIIQLSTINRPKIYFVQAEKWIDFMSALNIPYRKVTFKVVSSLV